MMKKLMSVVWAVSVLAGTAVGAGLETVKQAGEILWAGLDYSLVRLGPDRGPIG